MIIDTYLHKDKDSNSYLMSKLDIPREYYPNFKYLLSEVDVKIDMDIETGEYDIVEFDGIKVKEMEELLQLLKKSFEDAIPQGAEQDYPEGSRYIQVSDTLKSIWLDKINNILGDK